MGYCIDVEEPSAEPVTVAEMAHFMRRPVSSLTEEEVAELSTLISAARAYGEPLCGLALAQRRFRQVFDRTMPPRTSFLEADYQIPRRSEIIKLCWNPALSVESFDILSGGRRTSLVQDVDFILHPSTTSASQLRPLSGRQWPADLSCADEIHIVYTAGYVGTPGAVHAHAPSPPIESVIPTVISTTIPKNLHFGIMNVAAFLFQNRGAAPLGAAIGRGYTIPPYIDKIFTVLAVNPSF